MTLPIERTRCLERVELFLLDLCDPKKTPRMSRQIRKHAAQLLRHYPNQFWREESQRLAPSVWGSSIEEKEDHGMSELPQGWRRHL